MTENPFQSGPPSIGEAPSRKIRWASIFWQFIRFGFACFVFIVVPIFIAPSLYNMFEEFGIELPGTTQLFVALADKLTETMVLSVPLIFVMLLGIELGIFHLPNTRGGRLVSLIWWMLLVSVLVFHLVAISMPMVSIISGLTGSKP